MYTKRGDTCVLMTYARMIIAVLAMSCSARATFPMIAGYEPRTNITDYLEKDLIQKSFEYIMESEECDAFDRGREFWENTRDPNQGGYLHSIPTYGKNPGETISDEWREYIEYFDDIQFHIQWVQKAFQRGKTTYKPRGNADWKKAFGGKGNEGNDLGTGPIFDGQCAAYEENVKKATSYVFNFIESMQLMQKAIDLVSSESPCVAQIDGCEDAIRLWDASVAIFVGSLEGTDGDNRSTGSYGKSLYALGDKRCKNYAVCGPNRDSADKDQPASVNIAILAFYRAGSQATYAGDVALMKRYKRAISAKAAIPFIQGTLRYSWRRSLQGVPEFQPMFSTRDKDVAEGAAFALGAIPKLWACSSKASTYAEIETKIGGSTQEINFMNVKLAFECNYRCLGISCAEVGSFLERETSPLPGAAACDDRENGSSEDFVCNRPNYARILKCRRFTGKPGIEGRSNRDYFLK